VQVFLRWRVKCFKGGGGFELHWLVREKDPVFCNLHKNFFKERQGKSEGWEEANEEENLPVVEVPLGESRT